HGGGGGYAGRRRVLFESHAVEAVEAAGRTIGTVKRYAAVGVGTLEHIAATVVLIRDRTALRIRRRQQALYAIVAEGSRLLRACRALGDGRQVVQGVIAVCCRIGARSALAWAARALTVR